MGRFGDGAQVADQAEHVRALHHDAGGLVVDQGNYVFGATRRNRRALNRAEQAGYGFHDFRIMGMQPARQDRLAALGDTLGHQHSFGGGGRTVIERGIGHFHAGQQRHLGLEFEQVLQGALRDLRLVGRVGGEEFRPLDQVIDGARHMMLVGARPAEEGRGAGRDILRRQF
jgi:hypothetical protein